MPLILQEAAHLSAVHRRLDEFLREAAASPEPITIEALKEMVETRAKVFLTEDFAADRKRDDELHKELMEELEKNGNTEKADRLRKEREVLRKRMFAVRW